MNAEDIIKKLNLIPHLKEGGFYYETYRSNELLSKNKLPDRYDGDRCFGTCIYYLLTPDTFSTMHKLSSDEIFHFYLGDTVEMINLFPDGSGKIINIGTDLFNGDLPQVVVEKNVWQGAKIKDGGKFALMGTTVAPGFEFADYVTGEKDFLIEKYPEFKKYILKLIK